jgi:photosystem II stability/assembly factor-like uncharacterized protein
VHLGGSVVRRSLTGLAACIIALLAVSLSACGATSPNPGPYAWGVGEGGVILATSDGGTHWVAQHSGTTDDLNDVAFTDARHGWAVGADRRLAAGVILATSDGGAHWVKQLTLPNTGLQDVACGDATHVWVSGFGNTTAVDMATSNGGRTWVRQASGDRVVDHLVFGDARHGWGLRGPTEIVATSDGGAHWHVQLVNKGDLVFTNIGFGDATHGWAVGVHTKPVTRPVTAVLSTSDGGAHWRVLGGPREEMGSLQGVGPIDPSHVVVTGDGMWFSTDAGRHWTTCMLTYDGKTGPAQGGVAGFAFRDATHGWAAMGAIMATSDGGASWQEQVKPPSNTEPYIRAVACLRQVAATTGP